MATKWGPNIVRDGLVLYLDAANTRSYSGSGTTWSDLSSEGHNASLINGPTFSGSWQGALVFDGSNDSALITNFSHTNLFGAGTIEMWYKLSNNDSNDMLIDIHHPDGASSPYAERDFFSIRANWSGNNTAAYYTDDSGTFSSLYFTSAVSGNAAVSSWNHIGYTVDLNASTKKVLYEYGLQVNSSTDSLGAWSTDISQIRIANGTMQWYPMAGYISVVRIYSKALTATEMLQNYNAHKGRFGL